MREILFRGKKKDSGEWVCGDLIQLHEKATYWYILPEGISSEMYEDEPYHFRQNDVMCSVALAKIKPETVGQFTGLTDKNGKKIFEGDIVLFEDECAGNYEYHDCTEKRCGVIVYDCGQFFLTNRIAVEMEDLIYDNVLDGEVIGNIHDNPELLGE